LILENKAVKYARKGLNISPTARHTQLSGVAAKNYTTAIALDTVLPGHTMLSRFAVELVGIVATLFQILVANLNIIADNTLLLERQQVQLDVDLGVLDVVAVFYGLGHVAFARHQN
jgi:hypothetical protein